MAEQNQPEVVETKEPEQEVQPSSNPRHAIEAEIAKQHEARRMAEEAALAAPEAQEAPEPEAPEEPAKPEMVKVKVEGHEYEVPKEQVDAEGGLEFYQKRAAANLIFQRAKQREDEANKLLADARKPVEQPKAQDDRLTKLVEAIRFETDPAKAAEAVKQLVSETQLTQEQVNQAVQAQIAADKAVEKFRADFPEIASDPLLTQMAVNLEIQARQAGNTEPSADLHQKIGKLLKERYVRPTQPLAEKQQKKATVTNIPQARSRASAPEAPKEKTVQEIINDERRARKQIV